MTDVNRFSFTNAKYIANDAGDNVAIRVTIDGSKTSHVPIAVGNVHYDDIKKQVDAGELTIQEAD